MSNVNTWKGLRLKTQKQFFINYNRNYLTQITSLKCLEIGTREQAYVYALTSAAVTYNLARACSSGSLFNCTCSTPPRDPPNGNFKWGGCGDNVRWSQKFAKRFIDSSDKSNFKFNKRKKTKNGKNNIDKKLKRLLNQLSMVNLHNNRVGRRIVEQSLATQCKCHGVSGSCSIKTCWKALPPLLYIGQKLLFKYTTALEVQVKRVGAGRKLLPSVLGKTPPNTDQLVYMTKSPDYCTRDERLGSYGTRGRYNTQRIKQNILDNFQLTFQPRIQTINIYVTRIANRKCNTGGRGSIHVIRIASQVNCL